MNRPDEEKVDWHDDLKERLKGNGYPLTHSMLEYVLRVVEEDLDAGRKAVDEYRPMVSREDRFEEFLSNNGKELKLPDEINGAVMVAAVKFAEAEAQDARRKADYESQLAFSVGYSEAVEEFVRRVEVVITDYTGITVGKGWMSHHLKAVAAEMIGETK